MSARRPTRRNQNWRQPESSYANEHPSRFAGSCREYYPSRNDYSWRDGDPTRYNGRPYRRGEREMQYYPSRGAYSDVTQGWSIGGQCRSNTAGQGWWSARDALSRFFR